MKGLSVKQSRFIAWVLLRISCCFNNLSIITPIGSRRYQTSEIVAARKTFKPRAKTIQDNIIQLLTGNGGNIYVGPKKKYCPRLKA